VQLVFNDVWVLGQQVVQLTAVDRHAGVLDADAVRFERVDSVSHRLTVGQQAVLGGQVDFDQVDFEPAVYKLLENAIEGDLRHFVAVEHNKRFGDSNLGGHCQLPIRWQFSGLRIAERGRRLECAGS